MPNSKMVLSQASSDKTYSTIGSYPTFEEILQDRPGWENQTPLLFEYESVTETFDTAEELLDYIESKKIEPGYCYKGNP